MFVCFAAALLLWWRGGSYRGSALLLLLLFRWAGQVNGHLLLHLVLFLLHQLVLLRLLGLAGTSSFRGIAERIGARRVGRRRAGTLFGHFQRLLVHPCGGGVTFRFSPVRTAVLFTCLFTAMVTWKHSGPCYTQHFIVYSKGLLITDRCVLMLLWCTCGTDVHAAHRAARGRTIPSCRSWQSWGWTRAAGWSVAPWRRTDRTPPWRCCDPSTSHAYATWPAGSETTPGNKTGSTEVRGRAQHLSR